MAIKLGTMLVQEGVVTLNQLDEALKFQTIFGGKLGTNLIEMGLADEEDIARVLSEKLRVPFTSSEDLLEIPAGTIKLVPKEIAEKYKVVPFHQEKKRLHLVMMDPSDLRAVDEIAFITGYAIRPMVAPEVSLVLALEKHYKIERDTRYIPVIKQVLKRRGLLPAAPKQVARSPRPDLQPAAETVWRENIAKHAIDQFSQALAEVGERNQVADLILEYIGSDFEKVALFLLRDGVASGWRGRIKEKALSGFEKFSLPLDQPSILKTVFETKSFYLGSPPDTPANNAILQLMRDTLPETTLLIPIVKQGRVICILYVSGEPSKLTGEFFELQKITHKAALALEILILKNKILMT